MAQDSTGPQGPVGPQGAQGLIGPQGPQGPQGPAGTGLTDGDKGDITVSGSGAVWMIDNGVVGTSQLGGDITAQGKALLDDATAADQRNTLGLGTLATQNGTFKAWDSPAQGYEVRQDFPFGSGGAVAQVSPWANENSGTGATTDATGTSNQGVRISTGTTATGRAATSSNSATLLASASGTLETFGIIDWNNQTSNGADTFVASFGFANITTGDPATCALFRLTVGLATVTFETVTRVLSSALETNVVSLPASGTFSAYKIQLDHTSAVRFYIDNVLVATHTVRIPTSAMRNYCGVRKTAGTTTRQAFLKAIAIKWTPD